MRTATAAVVDCGGSPFKLCSRKADSNIYDLARSRRFSLSALISQAISARAFVSLAARSHFLGENGKFASAIANSLWLLKEVRFLLMTWSRQFKKHFYATWHVMNFMSQQPSLAWLQWSQMRKSVRRDEIFHPSSVHVTVTIMGTSRAQDQFHRLVENGSRHFPPKSPGLGATRLENTALAALVNATALRMY